MKRIAALILCLVLTLSLAACGIAADDRIRSAPSDTTTDGTTTTTAGNTTTTTVGETPDGGEDTRTNEEILADLGYKIHETQNDDGSVTVEIVDRRDDEVTPPIPTMPVVIPTAPTTKPTTTTTATPTTTTTKPATTTTAKPTTTTTAKPTTTTTKPTTTTTAKPTTTTTKPTTTTTKPTTTTTTKPTVTRPTYTYTTGQKHTALPVTRRYIYTTLSAEKQGWYRTIDKAIKNMEDSATFYVNMGEDRNYYIYYFYMFDNPELWYLGNSMTISNLGNGQWRLEFCYSDMVTHTGYGRPNRYLTDELRASIRAKDTVFKKKVNDILSTIPANAPAVEKERLIYDYILKTSYYNLGARWNGLCEPNWNAYGILVNGYGVCESYAEAFQTLCLQAGINCTGIVGSAGGGHKWNAVQLDGEWYACDITFDDPIGGDPNDAYHMYFTLTTEKMEELHHTTENSDFPGPQCNGTRYSYNNYFRNAN